MSITSGEIRNLRQQLRINQQELATRVGVTREAVSAWETGRIHPSGSAEILLRQIEATLRVKAPRLPVIGTPTEISEKSVDSQE